MHSEQMSRLNGEIRAETVVRGTCVRVSSDSARVGVPGQEPPAESRIEIIRSGDVIQAIDIICGCGQHIRLHWRYQEGKARRLATLRRSVDIKIMEGNYVAKLLPEQAGGLRFAGIITGERLF